jgi:predicted dehydrogenase
MTEAKTLRVGIIGAGGMGYGHCKTIRADVPEMTLAAVADNDLERAAKVAGEFGVPHFGSYEDLIRAKVCDAAIVAVPHPMHAEIAIACMKQGLHVLTEKPLSERVSAADKMLATAKRKGVALAAMFQQRFAGPFAKAIEIAQSGRLGTLIRALILMPDIRTQAYYDAGGWRATWRGEGGGVIINQAPHMTDVFVQLVGLPVKVRARTLTRLHDIEVEDCADALLTFKDGGIGYLYASTIEPGAEGRIELFCEKGRLVVTGGDVQLFEYRPAVGEFIHGAADMWARHKAEPVPLEFSKDWPNHKAVMRNFARHILSGEALLCSGESALGQLELANAIILSGHTGKEVTLPINRAAYDRLLMKLRVNGKDPAARVGPSLKITDPGFAKK